MSDQVSMTESRKTFPQTSSVRTVISGNIGMVDKTDKKHISSKLQKIKSKLPNVGKRLRSLMKWRDSKKIKSKEEATVFTMAESSWIIPDITGEILERILPESSAQEEAANENGVQFETTDNPLAKSCGLGFPECQSVSFSLDIETTFPSTSSSNPRLETSEAIIEKIMSEVNTIQVSSSNPSASTDSSNPLMNGIPCVNLGNIVNDPVDLLLAINSQIGLQTGRDCDTQSATLYLMNESRTDSYGGSSTSGNVSNTTESENSSISEVTETVDSQMSEQDPNRQYYEIIRLIMRKQFESLDDDPSLY
ncbi:uncharacterized protein LOC117177818 isoform X2 [Belonocnema kinseyi]|uniref:uncharacterized protein LOC117177818 isoform X2 n=1 Tax=Belonocnema kinseyi TaxID=2817044 RepID=UPI00143E006F|nr:uncharacterized protein LOC117177818 isoform X2 [Belonocnema kinseyi]